MDNLPAKAKPGRRLNLDRTKIAKVCDYLRAGNYFETAVTAAGMSPAACYKYLENARKLAETGVAPPSYHPLMTEFLDAITRADAEAEVAAVATLRRHSLDDSRAAVEFLRRRYPTRWGERAVTPNTEGETKLNELLVSIASQAVVNLRSLPDQETEDDDATEGEVE